MRNHPNLSSRGRRAVGTRGHMWQGSMPGNCSRQPAAQATLHLRWYPQTYCALRAPGAGERAVALWGLPTKTPALPYLVEAIRQVNSCRLQAARGQSHNPI